MSEDVVDADGPQASSVTSMGDMRAAREEIVDNVITDVEREADPDEEDRDIRTPYDPKAIRVDPRVYSVRQILDMVAEGELDLAPDFQRLKVWKVKQKSSLIESLLLRIPLPAFYFSSDEDGLLQVVDGVQRLTTINDFVQKNAFKLHALEYLDDAVGEAAFSEIKNTVWSRRILNTQITAFVIDPQTPRPVKFDIFRRINTGGTPLNGQEIRHCMSRQRCRDFLGELSADQQFDAATGGAFRKDVRMVNRELALRFTAFRRLTNILDYQRFGAMDDFLTWATADLDDPSIISDSDLAELREAFSLSMRNAQTVFGDHAFRKWFLSSEVRHPINRSLFDVWSVELSRLSEEQASEHAEQIRFAGRQLMTDNSDFLIAISAGTGTTSKVVTRFLMVQRLLSSIVQ